MGDHHLAAINSVPLSSIIILPSSVEEMLSRICSERGHPPPDIKAREKLAEVGEELSLQMLNNIYSAAQIRNLNGFIIYLYKNYKENPSSSSIANPFLSPQKLLAYAAISREDDGKVKQLKTPPSSISDYVCTPRTNNVELSVASLSDRARQLYILLSELEFRKAFLLFSYIGRNKVEDVMSVDDAGELLRLKNLPMEKFESEVWSKYGQHYLEKDSPDRRKHLDWDSGKTHLYYCHVCQDGTYSFKGPCLNRTKTHLQRALGDENILIVTFEEETKGSTNFAISSGNYNAMFTKFAEEGILVGLRRYCLFGFKDGGKEAKKRNPYSSAVKFYFVRMESIAPCDESEPYILAGKTMHEARCLFMHLHMTSSMAKYVSRFSLIVSKTIKLQVDLESVLIEDIEDIPCRDQKGNYVYEDGEPLTHTDGTGYISEDLAMKCPKGFHSAKFIKDEQFEVEGNESCIRELPLLIQCRLFKNGRAFKGTLLVNRKLESGTIQVRPSMIKVMADSRISNEQSFNSLEVVAISHKPKRCTLSKNLIALLSYGGVPKEFFLDLLGDALENARSVFSNKRVALQFLSNHGDRDDVSMAMRMIFCGVPLSEPCLQNCLARLASEEKKGLQGGKIPISESYYLMGTADPTGELNNNEVCVILDNGQLSGNVLVYRNPGLHFGDIHVLKAKYVEALTDVVGNAKFAIFFSTKGERSMAREIGDGDLDGDMYWVSQNPELLAYYKASPPWNRTYSTPDALQRKPSELSSEQLERELIRQYLSTRDQSNNMGVAADSWLAFMDRLLILRDDSSFEKEKLKKSMLHLVDIYYDALDAPKSGKKVEVPKELKAEKLPHYLGRGIEYNSTSVLGLIYDTVQSSKTETVSVEEVWKLPYFENVEIPDDCLSLWKQRYTDYKREMSEAMKLDEESKNSAADDIINKYKQKLYGPAMEFEKSDRKVEEIYNDALALYHAVYDYAKSVPDAGKCSFAWKVAGSALCMFFARNKQKLRWCVYRLFCGICSPLGKLV